MAIKLKPKGPRTKFVALDATRLTRIIAEGVKPGAVAKKAEKTGKKFLMMYVGGLK